MILTRRGTLLMAVFLMLFSLSAAGQAGPPPPAMPSENNRVLIDQILQVTGHEAFFREYCTRNIRLYAEDHDWPAEKTAEVQASVEFRNYVSTLYNAYAFYTKAQLARLLKVMKELSTSAKNSDPMVLTNQMTQSNLENYVHTVIGGAYLKKR